MLIVSYKKYINVGVELIVHNLSADMIKKIKNVNHSSVSLLRKKIIQKI